MKNRLHRLPSSSTMRAWFAGLALVSAMLMVFAPSVSRIMASHAVAAVSSIATDDQEECPEHAMMAHGESAMPAAPQPHHPPGTLGDEACGYCTLAAHLLASAPHYFVGAGALLYSSPVELDISAPQRRTPANLRSLGSQAPPLA